jgi:N6-L-threonylcarbamoyladenine synthase
MVGWKAAQALAYAIDRPLIGVNHVAAHLYSAWFSGTPTRNNLDDFMPNISLIASGGHTIIAKVKRPLDHEILGQTQDDAAGECFDKAAKLLGLGYPGGPDLDRLARDGDPEAFRFARPMLNKANNDLSFSGLKTSIRYFLEKNPSLLDENRSIPNLCASIQAAIVEVLLKKTLRAARCERVKCITVSGGVACNSLLRSEFRNACTDSGIHLRISPQDMCTDNAGMIGLLAETMYAQGAAPAPLEEDIIPNWAIN